MKNIVKKGFSLIELLVVVAIIGILAGIAIVGYNSYVDSADESVLKANSSQLARKIAVERAKPVDFRVSTYPGTCPTSGTAPTSISNAAATPEADGSQLANAAACYAKNQNFAGLETTLTATPAAGKMSVSIDAKVYYKIGTASPVLVGN
jgi:prepilin-type N-terminal cleavage/methylation domain-containing protein